MCAVVCCVLFSCVTCCYTCVQCIQKGNDIILVLYILLCRNVFNVCVCVFHVVTGIINVNFTVL